MTTRNSTDAQLRGDKLKQFLTRATFAMYLSSAILIALFFAITKN